MPTLGVPRQRLVAVFRLIPKRWHSTFIGSSRRSAACTNFRRSISGSVWIHGIRTPDPARPPRSPASVTHVPGHECHPCTRVGPQIGVGAIRELPPLCLELGFRNGNLPRSRGCASAACFSRLLISAADAARAAARASSGIGRAFSRRIASSASTSGNRARIGSTPAMAWGAGFPGCIELEDSRGCRARHLRGGEGVGAWLSRPCLLPGLAAAALEGRATFGEQASQRDGRVG